MHAAEHPADHPGPLVFVDDLDTPRLLDADRHHLERVLRVRPGDPLTIADGHGRWRTAVLGEEPTPTGPVAEQPVRPPPLTVAFALVKGAKPEVVVQKLTELGIDRIVPFRAARSVVQWDDAKAAKAVLRLRAVARAAAMQCHRACLPEIAEVASFDQLASEPGAVLADRAGHPPALGRPVVLVGPEGGWAAEERARELPRMTVGEHVLRAETAAIAAGVLMAALRAAAVGPTT